MHRKTTKEILVDSLKELAQSKSIDKITVKDITANCGYSNATFYRQFKDKYDLIAWAYSHDVEQLMERIVDESIKWEEILQDAANYYLEHKQYLENLLLHTSGYDSFFSNMTEINYDCLLKKIITANKNIKLDKQTEMMIRIYVLGTVCFTCEWILGKCEADPKTLTQAYMQSLPEPLQKYLY